MIPDPTPILRVIHVDNLHIYIRRGGLHAPNFTPEDGLLYKTIHNEEIQQERHTRQIPCGPRGVVHDYVPYYFGYLSPMMLQLKTGRVPGYTEGQEPLIYLVTTSQTVQESGTRFVFTDGHGIAAWTNYYDNLEMLGVVDWSMVNERYWRDTNEDMDRQRRKQAEFLIHEFCDWSLIQNIVVIDSTMKKYVEEIMGQFPPAFRRPVNVRRDWYYY